MAKPEIDPDIPRNFTHIAHDRYMSFPRTQIVGLDGTDSAAKIANVTRGGATVGLVWSLLHSMPFPPATAGQFAISVVNKTALCALMGAIFAGTTSVVGTATGKDRKINYFVGGCVAGSVLGARSKSIMVGTNGCVALGGFAVLRKWYDEHGWEFK